MDHERGEMRKTTGTRVGCPNGECEQHGRHDAGNVVRHGFSKVNGGRRRRYRCASCSKTFGATTGTRYKRLQHSKSRFDGVAALSVEGVNKSAIARLEGLSWNTIARWLELAAALARRFNAKHLRGHELVELNTFLQNRKQQTWVFASIDVWSRLWPATLVGSRTYRNTRRFVRSVADVSHGGGAPLITTDGFKFYAPTIRHVLGVGCVLAQVIKKIKRNRVVRVGTKLIVGTEWRLSEAHSALKFGKVTRTPAMQAGLAAKRLTFRDISTARYAVARFAIVRFRAEAFHEPVAGLRWSA
jgi:IS1 family transposase